MDEQRDTHRPDGAPELHSRNLSRVLCGATILPKPRPGGAKGDEALNAGRYSVRERWIVRVILAGVIFLLVLWAQKVAH